MSSDDLSPSLSGAFEPDHSGQEPELSGKRPKCKTCGKPFVRVSGGSTTVSIATDADGEGFAQGTIVPAAVWFAECQCNNLSPVIESGWVQRAQARYSAGFIDASARLDVAYDRGHGNSVSVISNAESIAQDMALAMNMDMSEVLRSLYRLRDAFDELHLATSPSIEEFVRRSAELGSQLETYHRHLTFAFYRAKGMQRKRARKLAFQVPQKQLPELRMVVQWLGSRGYLAESETQNDNG